MSETCPVCGQLVRGGVRAGVRLPRLLAHMFDRISRRKMGLSVMQLAATFYPGKSSAAARRCVVQNIWRLRELLETSPYQILSWTDGTYKVVRRGKAQ